MFQELLQPRKNGVFNHFLFVFILSRLGRTERIIGSKRGSSEGEQKKIQ